MPYKVIKTTGNVEMIEGAVNAHMDAGWQPLGGICATMHQGSGCVSYYQALVSPHVTVEAESKPEEPAPLLAVEAPFVVPTPFIEAEPLVAAAPFVPAAPSYDELKRGNTRKRKGVSNAN